MTLHVASEKKAYVLTDSATFRAMRARLDLVALSGADPALRKLYFVLRVAPERFPAGQIHAEAATKLADHLLSPASREVIQRVGDDGPLFTPLAGAR